MTVQDLISILQQNDPAAVVVLSMCPCDAAGDRDLVAAEPADICAVQLRAVDDEDYRARYAIAIEDGVDGLWLG